MALSKYEYSENAMNKKRKNKECYKCNRPVELGTLHCEVCNGESRERLQNKRDTAKLQGLCVQCSVTKATIGLTCLDCWYEKTGYNRTNLCGNGPMLRKKLEKQNFKCKYTNKKLIPGDNASVDHIISKANGGSDEDDNLCWCDLTVNFMKRELSLKDFLVLCEQIYSHCINMPEHPEFKRTYYPDQLRFDFAEEPWDDEGQLKAL